jgi:16S rRNA processing protein RimM
MLLKHYTVQSFGQRKQILPELSDGDYYWSDLLDMWVWTVDGQLLGQVDSMMETGANDVLVVRNLPQEALIKERLIPWLPEQVVTLS